MYFVPVVTTASVVGIIMIFIFGSLQGPVNHLLISLHILKKSNKFSWKCKVCVAYVSDYFSLEGLWYLYDPLVGRIAGVSQDVYEAATIDGANRSQTFLHIVGCL